MDINYMTQGFFDCECGRIHTCPIEHVIIGQDALSSLAGICKGYNNILMVSDRNTYRVCGKEVADILRDKVASDIIFETGDAPLIPNEEAIEAINAKFKEGIELVLGVGSGVINDLCKIVSFQHQLPYYIVATAP